jgi:hypothetical protein
MLVIMCCHLTYHVFVDDVNEVLVGSSQWVGGFLDDIIDAFSYNQIKSDRCFVKQYMII